MGSPILARTLDNFGHFCTLFQNFSPGLFLELRPFEKRIKEKDQTILHVSCCTFVLLCSNIASSIHGDLSLDMGLADTLGAEHHSRIPEIHHHSRPHFVATMGAVIGCNLATLRDDLSSPCHPSPKNQTREGCGCFRGLFRGS